MQKLATPLYNPADRLSIYLVVHENRDLLLNVLRQEHPAVPPDEIALTLDQMTDRAVRPEGEDVMAFPDVDPATGARWRNPDKAILTHVQHRTSGELRNVFKRQTRQAEGGLDALHSVSSSHSLEQLVEQREILAAIGGDEAARDFAALRAADVSVAEMNAHGFSDRKIKAARRNLKEIRAQFRAWSPVAAIMALFRAPKVRGGGEAVAAGGTVAAGSAGTSALVGAGGAGIVTKCVAGVVCAAVVAGGATQLKRTQPHSSAAAAAPAAAPKPAAAPLPLYPNLKTSANENKKRAAAEAARKRRAAERRAARRQAAVVDNEWGVEAGHSAGTTHVAPPSPAGSSNGPPRSQRQEFGVEAGR